MLIPLDGINGEGSFAICDDEDYEQFICEKWLVSHQGYVYRNGWKDGIYRMISMQWDVTGHEPSRTHPVDHINRNKLDNRRENLRWVTKQEDIVNQGIRSDNTSGFKGVQWDTRRNKWIALCGINHRKQIGSFPTPEEAAEQLTLHKEREHSCLLS